MAVFRRLCLQVPDLDQPFTDVNEAHGENWANLEDNVDLDDDGLEALGLGGEVDEEFGANEQDLLGEVPAQYDDNNYEHEGNYDDTLPMEAEEEPQKPVSAAMRKKQREHEENLALVEQVKVLCIKMEKALEDDAEDVMNGRPGLRKLTMLNEVSLLPASVLICVCSFHSDTPLLSWWAHILN